MKGIFIQGDVKNHNQRIYPASEIRSAVENLNEDIKNGITVLGEADHPENLGINISRVSHMITEMRMEGNNGIGKLKIIDTPLGNICKTIIESGGTLGVSSRGSGDVDNNGYVSNFEIVTVDIVVKPSAPQAYPKAVYEKRLYNLLDNKNIRDLAESYSYDRKAQLYLAREISGWMKNTLTFKGVKN